MNFMDKLAMVKIVTECDKAEMTKQAASGEEASIISNILKTLKGYGESGYNAAKSYGESGYNAAKGYGESGYNAAKGYGKAGVDYAKEHPLRTVGGIGAGGAGMYGAKKVYDNYL